MAKLIYSKKGYADTILFLVQQSVEKYMKGLLVHKRIVPKRTHDLSFLLGGITRFDASFGKYFDFCDKATKYYLEERYPPGPPVKYSYEEIEKTLEEALKLIEKIKETVNESI